MTSNIFIFDQLAIICTALILFICFVVGIYSKNYLRGDKKRPSFFLIIFLIATSLIFTFSSDNIFLFSASWTISNFLLVMMMIHKKSWKAAFQSGILALKTFLIGSVCLLSALLILHFETQSYSIREIITSDTIDQRSLIASSILILITALTQSAIYPFHKWLLSSLNSPTPASAIMHAGLVNGGGILLVRFAPLIMKMPNLMTLIFIIGIISAIFGTLWKLIQSNVKGMLACSTISQMGFMIAQCGMGLFPAAITHLFWHGIFKSYLFLSSPSVAQEIRLDLEYPPKIQSFVASILCGIIGAIIFTKINVIELEKFQSSLVLVAISFIAASQVALTIIGKHTFKNFIPALILSAFLSFLYATSVVLIEKLLPAEIFAPQQLNIFHVIATLILFLMWFVRLFWKNSSKEVSPILLKIYVKLLNQSQPKSSTITSNRNQYNFR